MRLGLTALLCAVALTGCKREAERAQDRAEDKMERTAEAQATAAGAEAAALGLTELQLLDADLRDANGVELGDVVKIDRDSSGNVSRLLIEVEDSKPDRFVYIPIQGLKTVPRGNEIDIQTTMTAAQLNALPAETLTP